MENVGFTQKSFQTWNLFQIYLRGLLISSILLYGKTEGYMVGKNPYRRVEMLDSEGKYWLEFEVDRGASRITFNVTVETTGYVGFGLSAKGKMSGADIVIGGVLPGGRSYFSDRHAVGNQIPELDPNQDWELHHARENGTHTFLSFSRALDTCDPQDYAIVEDKVSLIWAYGERDDQLGYHYNKRGEYPVHLLSPDYTPQIDRDPKTKFPLVIHSPFNEDVKIWSWHEVHTIPRYHTIYWCSLRRGPFLSKKHHMIGFDMRFNNEVSKKHLHHVRISRCRAPPGFSDQSLFEQYVNQGQLCYDTEETGSTGPIRIEYCTDFLYASSLGNRIIFLPPNLGTPFGENPQEYYILQMHFDNPEEKDGIVVDVNMDIFYTPHLRKNEGGLMALFHEVPGLPPSFLIPPSSINQKIYNICGAECSRKMFPTEGIRISTFHFHAHNHAVGVRLRHFREDSELTSVAVEDNFSPSYQQVRALPEEVHVLPGDQLVLDCTFDNVLANGTVVAGFSTKQEMCVAWFFYYNRLPHHNLCASQIDSPEFRESFLGIQNITWSTQHLEYLATSPRRLAGLPVSKVSDMLDWTEGKRAELNGFLLTYPHSNLCPVSLYARAHTKDKNGEPVDLKPEEDLTVLTPLPAQTRFYEPRETCSEREHK